MKDESLKDKSMKDKSMKDKSMKDESLKDKSMKDESILDMSSTEDINLAALNFGKAMLIYQHYIRRINNMRFVTASILIIVLLVHFLFSLISDSTMFNIEAICVVLLIILEFVKCELSIKFTSSSLTVLSLINRGIIITHIELDKIEKEKADTIPNI